MKLFKKFAVFVTALGLMGALTTSSVSTQNVSPGGSDVTGIVTTASDMDFTLTTPAANTSLYDFTVTIPITAAGQTTNVFDLSVTNTNHTGGNVNGINVGGITGDADATEYAINIGTGWDVDLAFASSASIRTIAAGSDLDIRSGDIINMYPAGGNRWYLQMRGSGDMVEFFGGGAVTMSSANATAVDIGNASLVAAVMDGSDTQSILKIDVTNADHTGASNFLYGLDIDGITADADATEYAINIGDGWDYEISFAGLTSQVFFPNNGDLVFLSSGSELNVRLDDAPASTRTGQFVDMAFTIDTPMDGSDTIQGLFIDVANANHTGASNFLYGLDIDGITGDADASEYAINIGAGWDTEIFFADGTPRIMTDYAAYSMYIGGAGGYLHQFGSDDGNLAIADTVVQIAGTWAAMNGSDTSRGLFIDFTNGDHTGVSNFLYGLDIDGITGDADAIERAINIGDGWDEGISLNDSRIELAGTGDDSGVRWTTTLGDVGSVFSIVRNAGGPQMDARLWTAGWGFEWYATGEATSSSDFMTWNHTAGIMDGSDVQRALFIDITNANHTGASNFLYGLDIDGITGDAQARETAINIGTGWDVSISAPTHIFERENFKQGFRKQLASDFSAATDTDGSVNIVLGTNGVNFEYREELEKTTSSFILNNAGALDISADDTVDNEGVEIMLGSSQTTTSGYLVAQTDQLCFSVNVKVTLIAGTDQFVIGWRGNEAYDAANVYTNYSDYSVVGINNVDGSVFGLSDSTSGAAETDDSTTNWADGETKTLKACIDGAGLPHSYLDGTLVVETNRTTAIDAGINMVPFISYLQAGGAVDSAILINWWGITAN